MHQAQSTSPSTRRLRSRRRGVHPGLMLGPAFVAGIAYVDPGNVATNFAAGSQFGYLLVWVIVAANLMAMLVQYLSAKLGIATGESLPTLCRKHFPRRATFGLWVQAEAVALATDLAEILGGAIALNLLFGTSLIAGGVITGAVSFLLLLRQGPHAQRQFERLIVYLLAVIAVGFFWSMVSADPDPAATAAGLVPRLEGTDSLLLATGMVGATVMPHAIYLHSALIRDRFGPGGMDRHRLLRSTRVDVAIAMTIAGAINLAMLLTAAGALSGTGVETLDQAYQALAATLGSVTAVLFAVALLASGLASSSVGTYAGEVILHGFLRRQIPLPVRRLLTLVPAVLALALGGEPTHLLVLSQVVLSFGIPFALWPLVILTRRRAVMGDLVNHGSTTAVAVGVASLVSVLNLALLVLTLGPFIGVGI